MLLTFFATNGPHRFGNGDVEEEKADRHPQRGGGTLSD